MPFVDFNISSERKVDSKGEDNFLEVNAYFSRGHYEANTYIRDEIFKHVTVVFLPDARDRDEIIKNLYDMLLTVKNNNDKVIAECIPQ